MEGGGEALFLMPTNGKRWPQGPILHTYSQYYTEAVSQGASEGGITPNSNTHTAILMLSKVSDQF